VVVDNRSVAAAVPWGSRCRMVMWAWDKDIDPVCRGLMDLFDGPICFVEHRVRHDRMENMSLRDQATSMANGVHVHIQSLGDDRRCKETWIHTRVVIQKRVGNGGRTLENEAEQKHTLGSRTFRWGVFARA
jgi:hypothetical protein